MKIAVRPDFLFTVLGVLLLLFGYSRESILDINIHDTYFVVPSVHIGLAFAIVFWLIAGIYFAFAKWQRPLGKVLGLLHFLFTLTMVAANIYITFSIDSSQYVHMSEEMEYYGRVNMWITLFVLVGLLGQLLFLVNIVFSLLRRKT